MADILSSVRGVLVNNGTVSGLVSTRVYPDTVPQQAQAYPCIVLSLVSQTSTINLGGFSGLANARVQVDCYAKTRLGAASLEEAVRLALGFYQGTSVSVVVRTIHPGLGFTTYDAPTDKGDVGLYRHVRDFSAWYEEATA